MNENETERPLEDALEASSDDMADAVAAVDQSVEAAGKAIADAAAEVDAPFEGLADSAARVESDAVDAVAASEQASSQLPKALPEPKENGARKQTIADRLAEDTEFDPDATNDDRVMAALAYASQLINPIGLVLPIIILVSETSKQRPFQRYHAVQSLAVSAVIGLLELGLTVLASAAGATVIGLLCLCFIVPAMIMLWLLPLYYAIVAYGGKRFRIPGLTQFLQDQRWL